MLLTLRNIYLLQLSGRDPAYLRRKRQKTNGDPEHLLLQQQQNQNDRLDGRLSNWNSSNVPTIKTEPRDTSPQPFGIYRAPPELTPSPQPLSPSNAYTHNTPSPYNITPTVTGNQQLISPNHQYNATNVGPSGSTNVNPNAPPQIDIGDYNAFGQETQQQLQQQQQYHGNNFGSAGATHWETKFNPAAAVTNNNLDNLTAANAFTMHNLLTPASADVGQANNGTGGAGNNWNLGSNHFHPQQHPLQQHQQYHQQTTNDAMTTANNTAVGVTNIINGNNENNNNNNNNTNNNNNEHGLSNLLTFDSGQLVRMNSEDQQMLRLNSEDLQISNLSIST